MPPKKSDDTTNTNNSNTAQITNSGNSNVSINLDPPALPRQTVQTNQTENGCF